MLERRGLGSRDADSPENGGSRTGRTTRGSSRVVSLLWILVVALAAGAVAAVGGAGAIESADQSERFGSDPLPLTGGADGSVPSIPDAPDGVSLVDGTVGQVSNPIDSNWSAFGEGANRTGHVDQSGPVVGATELWTASTSGYVDSSPAVVDGTVYVGSGYSGQPGFVYAFNATDGTQEWAYNVGESVQSSPAVAGGTVYVGADDATVYALNATDGTEEWTYPTGEFTVQSSPIVVDGTVYVGTNGHLLALNASDGTEEWNFATDTPSLIGSSPAVAGGTVYVGSSDDHVYALDATTGTEAWNYSTDSNVISSPAVFDGTVYIGSGDGKLYALSTAGALQWAFQTDGQVDSSPAVADGSVYVGSMGGTVYAVDAASGTEEWNFTANADVESSPAVAGNTVYVGSYNGSKYGVNNSLYALDASTGAKRWNYTTGGTIQSSPAVSNGVVFIGSRDTKVYALTEPSVPDFQVTVDSTNTPVAAGDTLTVDATVQNTGDASGTQGVTLSVDGTQVDSTTETLPAGGSTQVTFSWATTDADAGSHTATVASEDDSDASSVTVDAVNAPPSASFSASTAAPTVGETVTFDATGSSDSDGTISAYDWTFGDGETATGATATHAYDTAGSATVTLTVTDDSGATATDSTVLSVEPSSDGGGDDPASGDYSGVAPSADEPGEDAEQPADDGDDQDAPETTVAVSTTDGPDGTTASATITDARAGEAVDVDVPAADGADPVAVTAVSVTPATDGSFTIDMVESASPLDSSPAFELGDGTTPLSYLSVEHSLGNANIESVTITARVDRSAIEQLDSNSGAVSLYRHEGTGWVEQPTSVVSEGDDVVVLQTTAPGLSEWTAAAKRPRLAITDSEASVETATTGDDVTIQVFVTNSGGTDGVYEARLLLNGQTVDRRDRTVPDGGTVALNFERTFDQAGVYEVRVNDAFVADVNISAADASAAVETARPPDSQDRTAEETPTDGTDASGGSLPLLPIGVVLVIVVGGAVWVYLTRIGD